MLISIRISEISLREAKLNLLFIVREANLARLAEFSLRSRKFSCKKDSPLERHPKGQLSKIRHISKEMCRIFAFVPTNAVLVRKIDKS